MIGYKEALTATLATLAAWCRQAGLHPAGGPASNQMAFLPLTLPGLQRLMDCPTPDLPVRPARAGGGPGRAR